MKPVSLLILMILTGCASHPKPVVGIRPINSNLGNLGPDAPPLRTPEVLRAYHLGRGVDPAFPTVMHEQHPVYRVEVSSFWNLHPNATSFPPGRAVMPTTPPTNDLLQAEISQQRAATGQVMDMARVLTNALTHLQGQLAGMQSVSTNLQGIQERLSRLEQAGDESEQRAHPPKEEALPK